MPLVPGTSHTVTKNSAVGGVLSSTIDPFQGVEFGRSVLANDYTTLTIAQASITEASPGVLTSAAHGLSTGDVVSYHSEGGTNLVTSVGTVADGTTYYVERMSADTFELATTAALAAAGTTLQITNDGNDNQTFRRVIGKVA